MTPLVGEAPPPTSLHIVALIERIQVDLFFAGMDLLTSLAKPAVRERGKEGREGENVPHTPPQAKLSLAKQQEVGDIRSIGASKSN